MNYDALKACRLFLLDMDGTLYLGDEVIHGAIDFIHTLEQTGRRYIYLTNNSSRAGTDYVNRLRKLGFPCEMENVFTSGMATGMYLAEEYKGVPVYPVGTPAFLDELRSYGVPLTDGEDAGVVCVGFDTTLTYEKLERGALHTPRRGLCGGEPGLGLSHGCGRGHARLRQHLRAAHGLDGGQAAVHRQAEPGYG